MSELVKRWHWTMGNGCVPFPGHRVENVITESMGTIYTITEYLGNGMAVSYREAFGTWNPMSEAERWAIVEHKFRQYVEEGPG